MTAIALAIPAIVLVALVAIVVATAAAHVRAAHVRRLRSETCAHDDDEARGVAREIASVVGEATAFGRLWIDACRATPRAWHSSAIADGGGPIVVLVAAHRLGRGSLANLGRRLEHDLGASVRLAPGGTADDIEVRAERLADRLTLLGKAARGRAVVVVGHGDGGLVARRAAAGLRLPGLRVVTLATAHRPRDVAADSMPVLDRVDVLNLYSLHDAMIVPAERAHLAGADNVVFEDEGHFGIVLRARPYEILLEAFDGFLGQTVAS